MLIGKPFEGMIELEGSDVDFIITDSGGIGGVSLPVGTQALEVVSIRNPKCKY